MRLTIVILTRDEQCHIARAIGSVTPLGGRVLVVDSNSTDLTVEIAEKLKAEIMKNPFVTQAQQFNWALDQLPSDTEWILRLDADEIVTPKLAREIREKLCTLGSEIDGVYVPRRMNFMGSPVRHGGLFPINVLRLFRYGRGRCEQRWMDEHILVDGQTAQFQGEIVDDNLKPLTWWTEKHNSYASREVVDLLNLEYRFMAHETVASLHGGQQAGVKRWIKEHLYARLPGGARAFAYFLYRFVLRLGFLDGREGVAFHVLQGFWYRYLVDLKLHEVKQHMRQHNVDAVNAIYHVLGIKVR